jgi:hypothetical protein
VFSARIHLDTITEKSLYFFKVGGLPLVGKRMRQFGLLRKSNLRSNSADQTLGLPVLVFCEYVFENPIHQIDSRTKAKFDYEVIFGRFELCLSSVFAAKPIRSTHLSEDLRGTN